MENIKKALYTLTYALRSTRAGKEIDYIEVTEEGCGLREAASATRQLALSVTAPWEQ